MQHRTMAVSLEADLERCCRLCAEEQEVAIMIFSDEAEAMLLHEKLYKYLMIKVNEDDNLPKNICIQCCSKLQSVCEFVDNAHQAQEVLLYRSLLFDGNTAMEGLPVIDPTSIKTESVDEETIITSMEISVDPMVVLQNQEMLSPNTEMHENVVDVTYLHGVDSEDVTIKLIRKGSVSPHPPKASTHVKEKKPFVCLTCQRRFCTEIALKNHFWTHREDATDSQYLCNSCDESFTSKNDLISHIKEHRQSGNCNICGRTFRSEQNLQEHMNVHLTSAKSFTCKVCGRSYKTLSNLKTHSITHSNERPFNCNMCKKSFKRNQDLKFHINQHTGAKPYKCPFCDKCFASSGNCYSHRSRMHPGKRPGQEVKYVRLRPKEGQARKEKKEERNQKRPQFKLPKAQLTTVKGVSKYYCKFCGHSFLKKDNFMYHLFQHTGEKPFQCSYCPEKFVTRKGLSIHHSSEHFDKDRPLSLLSKNALLK